MQDSGFRRFVIPLTADSLAEESREPPRDDRQNDLFGPLEAGAFRHRRAAVGRSMMKDRH
jgi:hypothetical protein